MAEDSKGAEVRRIGRKKPRIMKFTLDVAPEQKVTLFDMRSQSTTTLRIYERKGALAVTFQAPSNIRIVKDDKL